MSKNTFCTFYIVRHGESEWNVMKLLQGQADSPLTENGINQARILGKEFKNIHFDFAFSSDSTRALRTAEIIALEHNLAVKTTRLLRERNFGNWEGRSYSIFQEDLKEMMDEFALLSDEKKKTYKYPGIENDEEIVVRFITFLRETALAYPGKTVLATTHGAMIRTLLIHLGLGTYDEIPHDAVGNSAYVKIESDGVDFFIKETKGVKTSRLGEVLK